MWRRSLSGKNTRTSSITILLNKARPLERRFLGFEVLNISINRTRILSAQQSTPGARLGRSLATEPSNCLRAKSLARLSGLGTSDGNQTSFLIEADKGEIYHFYTQ
jgi:hypothetical protein